jgi:hypothetical protein
MFFIAVAIYSGSGAIRRPSDGCRHAQIDAEPPLIPRKRPDDIGHHHYQGGTLRSLLIHAREKPE